MSIPTSQDEAFMQRALSLAAATIGLASPNPQVGCVLVRNNEIIAEGAHFYDQYDHAEIVALKQAAALNRNPEGATAYVTLEPCSHHGRTGPCADALIAARVGRVVVATQDPNPRVSGQGIARLEAAEIEVTVGVLQQPARHLNDSFAHSIRTSLPFVTLKAALSADGKLAPNPLTRIPNQPHWLTGPAARADVQHLRHASDAILTGIGTILADDPALTDRTSLPRRRPLLRVVLDSHLRTPLTAQVAQQHTLILCTNSAPADKAIALEKAGVAIEPVSGQLSLPAILATLARRSIQSLLLEAGPTINGAFLQQDLVDHAILYFSETELGPEAVPFAAGGPSPYLLQQRLKRTTRTTFPNVLTDDARITGYLHDPWEAIQSDVR